MSLVYLLTTLPILDFADPAPLAMDELFQMIKSEVEEKEYKLLWNFIYNPEKVRHPVLQKWVDWHRSLQHELSIFRAKNLGREEQSLISTDPMPYAPMHLAEECLHALNPYEGQKHLRAGEWEFLEQLSSTHYQSIVNLAIYTAKLQILISMDLYQTQTGIQRLEQFYKAAVTEKILDGFLGENLHG